MISKNSLAATASLLLGCGTLPAQDVTHIDWSHVWSYMHPMGILPPEAGATEPNAGATKWYALEAEFNATYSGPTFGGALFGTPGIPDSYDSGSGPGPIGYGAIDYTTSVNLPTGEFFGLGTTLTIPNTGNRGTSYFRTTFTVPDTGGTFVNPVISYILDDGGYIYLDGVPILRVNMQGTMDEYTTLAAGTANTESHIRFANLNLPAGSSTGGNALNAAAIPGNAVILQPVMELAPGVHTLAVSVHNPDLTSSDLGLAVRLVSTEVDCAINAVATNLVRNFNGTPLNPSDDSVSFSLTVTPSGNVSPAGWVITGPVGSAVAGRTGSYNVPVAISNVPIAQFPSGGLQVLVQDSGNATCTSTVAVLPPPDGRERTHVNWNHTWSYMHPMGVLPPGSGSTEPNAGATKWYAPQAEFNATYSGPTFGGALVGNPLVPNSYDSGSGPGPLGYGDMAYTGTAEPLFSGLATTLTTPESGNRRTGYFRTTFTVPAANLHVQPVIRYILDDGGYVYLDGVPILRVNMQGTVDEYTTLAANTTNTEDVLRFADLSLPVGSVTGDNPQLGIAGNAVVLQQILTLAPGTHTLAVSVHNPDLTSSDLDLAIQVVSTESDCAIVANLGIVTRAQGVDPADPFDDTVAFGVTVVPTGNVGAGGWIITGPAGSAAVGRTGNYNTPSLVIGIPIGEFPPSGLPLQFADAGNRSCNFTVPLIAPRVIGSNSVSIPNATVISNGALPPAWVIDEANRTLTMSNGGGGAAKVVRSQSINLSSVNGVVLFTGELEVTDTSGGTEPTDTFLAELILNGDTANPINLISAYDTQVVNGVMDDDELAPNGGFYVYPLRYYIPDNVNSAQIVISGVNDSANETFVVRNLQLGISPPALFAVPDALTYNNQGTVNPDDDTFSAVVTITPVNLGASTGWSSNAPPPAGGLYAAPNPVTFGPYPVSGGQRDITLTDNLNGGVTAFLSLAPEPPALAVSVPTNVVRIENGPGFDDDTVTFDVIISGTGTGPSWNAFNATPASGAYGPVTFTLSNLFGSVADVFIEDASFPQAFQNLTVNFPDRYIIGQVDLGGGPSDLETSLTMGPEPQWINDAFARTLTMNNGGGGTPKSVTSEVVDLSTVVGSTVAFSALLQVVDTSGGTEDVDSFVAELVLDGDSGNPVNLITPYDFQVVNGVMDNDELAPAGGTFDYPLTYTIPDNVQSVQLVIRGVNDSINETLIVRDVLVSLGELDSDEDGIPDSYEDANGLNKFDPNDALLDLDGDGQNNLAEYLAGTQANNANSRLQVTANAFDKATGNFSITWRSVPGKSYRIQVTPDLATPFFDLTPTSIPGSAGATTTANGTIPGPIANFGFMRIRALP